MRIAVLLLLGMLSGCAYIEPLIQDFNLISVAEERQIGAQIAAEIAKEKPLLTHPTDLRRVQSIGQQLVRTLDRREFDYQFHIVKDRTPNAFTIPGGSIYVHTGLLQFTNDSELAGVLAHEVGHAYDRHPAKNLSRAYGAEYLSGLLFKGKNPSQLKSLALQLAAGGVLSRYGREDERRADEIGYHLLKKAGFETAGLLRFLRKLQSLGSGGSPIPFLSTHPPTPERIQRLETLEYGATTPQIPAATRRIL